MTLFSRFPVFSVFLVFSMVPKNGPYRQGQDRQKGGKLGSSCRVRVGFTHPWKSAVFTTFPAFTTFSETVHKTLSKRYTQNVTFDLFWTSV